MSTPQGEDGVSSPVCSAVVSVCVASSDVCLGDDIWHWRTGCCPCSTSPPLSTWTQVISGVPHGTVLGPLLFLTYVNDLPNNIHSSIRMFADDCVLYREIKNENDSQELHKYLNSLMKWEYDWQMHFNPQKCFVLRLTHARHLTRFNYILGDTSLQETDNHPYLGFLRLKTSHGKNTSIKLLPQPTVPLHS